MFRIFGFLETFLNEQWLKKLLDFYAWFCFLDLAEWWLSAKLPKASCFVCFNLENTLDNFSSAGLSAWIYCCHHWQTNHWFGQSGYLDTWSECPLQALSHFIICYSQSCPDRKCCEQDRKWVREGSGAIPLINCYKGQCLVQVTQLDAGHFTCL